MAGTNQAQAIPVVSGEDLTGDLYKFAVINSSGQMVVNTTAQGAVDGIVNEEVDAAGKGTSMLIPNGGRAKILLGATLAAGALVASGSDGRAVAAGATAGNKAVGRLMAGGDAGEVVDMLFAFKDINPGT